jgi:hypothetical protein
LTAERRNHRVFLWLLKVVEIQESYSGTAEGHWERLSGTGKDGASAIYDATKN